MATIYDQQKTTYSDTNNQERVISDLIQLIDPADTPLLDALGGIDTARGKFNLNEGQTKIEWLEDEYMPLSTTAAQGTTIATNDTSLTVADASILKDGDIILVDSELMVVSSANATSNTIGIYSRSYGGTNATHASTATVYIVGQGRLEGDDADYRGLVQLTTPYNYTSIFQEGLKVSGTDEAVKQIGYANAFDYQAMKAMKDIFRRIEKSLFYSVRTQGSASAPRTFGGLETYITSNTTTASSGAVTKTVVDNLAETMLGNGALPDLLVVHPGTARDLKDILDTSSYIVDGNKEENLGRVPVKYVTTQFFTLRLVISRWVPVTKAFMLDSSKMGLYTLRPFKWYEIARSGDSRKGEVLGELSLVVASDKAHGKILGIST